MRKSFTRFLNVFMALVFSLGAYAASSQTYVPTDGSPNFKKTDEVSVTFDSDVTKGTGYVRFYEDDITDVPLFVELVSDSRIVVSGKKVVFQFNSLMADSKDYYVTWDAGAFKLGTTNVAALGAGDWNWTTGDYTGPVVDVKTDGSHLSPKKGATNVLTTTTTLSILFNENVQPTSGTEKVYLMKDNGGTYGDVVAILGASALSASGKTININVTSLLEQNTTYYVLIDNGAIRDASTNSNKYAGLTDKTVWSFSTTDTSAPVMTIAEKEVSKTKVSYDVAFSEKGKLFYIVLAGGETDVPTSAQVKAGVNYTGATVLASGTTTYTDASSKVIEVTTLTNNVQGGTEFDFYFVSETYINVSGVSETLLTTPVMKDVKMVDNVKPLLLTKTPTGTDVAKDAKLVMTFDEVVKLGTGSVTVKKTTDNTVFATFDIAGATLSTDKKTVTIDLPTNFASTTQYYVLVPSTTILDEKDNAYLGIGSTTTWAFTSEDYAAPTFTFTPANGSSTTTAATLNTNGIKLTFGEEIEHRDGSPIADNADLAAHGLNQALILKENGTEKAMNYIVTTGTPNIITVTPDGWSFAADTEYSLTFLGWYVADLDGNIIQNSSELVFRTADDAAPTVANLKPDHLMATDNILVNFSEPVRLANNTELNDTNVDGVIVSFNAQGGAALGFDATVSADKKQIIINPTVDLLSQKTYEITLTSGLEDYANNPLVTSSSYVYTITADDYIKPVATLTPANGAAVAAGTISGSVAFGEAVTKLIGTPTPDASILTLREGSETGALIPITGGTYAANTLPFTAPVAAGKTYYLTVGASVQDGGNNVNDAVTSVFTTLSNAVPTIATTGSPAVKVVTPLENATAVATDAAITVTFTDPIAAIVNESLITITSVSSGSATVTGSSLSADGKTLTITHAAMPANETVTVTLDVAGSPITSSAVQSQTGTLQTAALSWSFKTVDTVAPSSPALSPSGTGVAIASTGTGATVLNLVFADTENLHLGTGSVKIRKVAGDAIVQDLGVAQMTTKSATGGNSDTKETVEIKLNADLEYATAYYVQVASTLILDAENNAYAGITSPATWTFTTEAAPAFALDIPMSDPTAFQDSVLETAPQVVMFNHAVATKDNSKEIILDEITYDNTKTVANQVVANNVFALPPSDPAFTWAGNQVTIDYVVDLEPNKAYRLTFDAGVATDVYGGALTGGAYVFFTSGAQGPIASFSPAKDEEGVAKDANIVITFDEPFFKNASGGTYAAVDLQNDLSIINVSGNSSGGNLPYVANIDGKVITLDLNADLMTSETVTVSVGAGKFYDADGNIYDVDMDGIGDAQTITFDVIDFLKPVAAVSGVTELKGTSFKYQVESNEKGSVYSLVTLATATATKADVKAGTTTAITDVTTPTPSSSIAVTGLAPSTAYKLWFFGVDETGNEQDLQSATVTTIDDVKPVLVKTLPENNAATTSKISFEFNEALTNGLFGAVLVKEKATGTIVEAYASAGALTNSNKTMEFATTNLVSSETYIVEADKGAFKDAASAPNAYDSFITFEFTTADEIAPTVKFTNPNNAGTPAKYDVTNGNGIEITFSEAVNAKTEKVKVYEDSGNGTFLESEETLVQLIDPASMTASTDNKVRTFDITSPLVQGKVYWVVVATTCFEDLAKNALAAQVVGKLNVVDTTAPVASHAFSPTVPATADVDVAIDNNIIINFDEKIFWTIHPVENYLHGLNVDSLVTVTGPNGAVAFDATINTANDEITINPTNSLKSMSTYVVTVSQVEDALGNLMDTYSFTFTTGEYNPPVAMFDPAHDTDNASAVGPFTITFDKNVYVYVDVTTSLPVLAPLTTANVEDYFILVSGGDIAVTANMEDITATVTDGKVVTIVPDAALADSGADDYTYGLKAGVSIYDELGNALTGANTSAAADSTYATITIQDLTVPTVVAKSTPVEVDDAMWIKFSEDIAVGAGNLFIRRVEDGELIETITTDALTVNEDTLFIAHADFPLNTNFYVVIDEGFATDLSGNKFAGIADDQVIYHATNAPDAWNFNTNDTMYPMVVDQSPAPGVVDVLVGQSLTITFNKAVQAGTGFIAIYEADGTPHQMIDVTNTSMVVFNQYAADTVVTILHTAFKAETGYFVRIDKGAIKDAAMNDFAGIADESWNFTTEDITAPTLEAMTPDDNSVDVSAVQVFEMEFDRNVAKGSGNIKIYDRTGATLIETLPISSENVVIDGKVVSFSFANALDHDSEYYIIVEAGAITNASVNAIPFAGITTALAWSFTTGGDMEAPVLTSATPDATTVLTDNHPTFVMTFDENVELTTAGGMIHVIPAGETVAKLDIAITADMIVDNVITIDYVYDAAVGGLDGSSDYYVTVDAGAIQDMAGNEFGGIEDAAEWTFTTGADWATGVENPVDGSLEFKVYPNPFADYVKVDNADKLSRIVITNVAGQRVKDIVNPTSVITTGDLRSGVYFITLIQGDVVIKTEKLTKR